MKILVLIARCFTQHIQSPWHYLNTEMKHHKFWRFKSHLYIYNHHSSKPRQIQQFNSDYGAPYNTTYRILLIIHGESIHILAD